MKLPDRLTWRFGVVVLLLTAISLGIGARTTANTNRNTRCLATYIAQNSQVSQARAVANTDKDRARDDLLDKVTGLILHPDTPPEVAQKRLQKVARVYREEKRELERTRAVNPLPDFPAQCRKDNS